jgi:hypothetical protein
VIKLQGPPPTTRVLGPTRHASWPKAEEAKPPRAVHATAQRLQAFLHFCPDQRVKGRTLSTPTRPAWRPRPTRHATGTPVATWEQLHRPSRHYRASSTAEPVPRLEATLRMTQQCQPGASVIGQSATGEGATVDAAKNGPAVMAVAGGRKQRSRRQPSSRPLLGQRENTLPRREDGAPVFRSSNDSRTRNGCPANHLPRRINSAVGQAATLAGEAGDASPSP